MELRNSEKELSELIQVYDTLRRTTRIVTKRETTEQEDPTGGILRSLPTISFSADAGAANDENGNGESGNTTDSDQELSLADVLSALTNLHDGIAVLQPKLVKFRKRVAEKDPITGAPRYGENTQKRVINLLHSFDALENAVVTAFGEHWLNDSVSSNDVVCRLRTQLEQEEEERRLAELEAKAREEQSNAAMEIQKAQEEEQKRQALEASRLARLREEAELAERAQQIRHARQEALEAELRAREEAEQADRQWVASIQKGPEGVREQLRILRHAIDDDTSTFSTVLNALHTLFAQIMAHPEEPNFRRVRRDHAKFHQDIGRHAGGREILIAAGFELGAIDGVPCFISKEPDIEKDMDGWSQWFDLLKATLSIIEEELIK